MAHAPAHIPWYYNNVVGGKDEQFKHISWYGWERVHLRRRRRRRGKSTFDSSVCRENKLKENC